MGFWRLRGSYSFLHMTIEKAPGSLDVGSAPRINGSSPQHQLMLQSSFDLPKRFSLDFDYRYESALPGLQIGSYATADTRVGWNFSRQWEVSVNGRNLLQPNHVEFASDPGPNVAINRSVYAKLVWRSREN
jgi:iron complex outermembrane receptor protein